jgi:hypothetical protein
MKLLVFNPEHDLALAANLSNFTAPHAGRQLRADLGFIPAIWAAADDYVLVENVEDAERRFLRLTRHPFERFIVKEHICKHKFTAVDVWGWDLTIRAFLLRWGIDAGIMPTVSQIDTIRQLSHRRYAMQLLENLQTSGTIGNSCETDQMEIIVDRLHSDEHLVIKAPWSSSGRGVRFMKDDVNIYDKGWLRHVIAKQGSVMVEPYYNKVKDFGMEFVSDGCGSVSYSGLSLFQTSNGAYTGNLLAYEDEKMNLISRYIPVDLIKYVQQEICTKMGMLLKDRYAGAFGIDMMVVRHNDGDGFLLHPCVEINLRRTMGHVAISLMELCSGLPKLMMIEYNANVYKIKINNFSLK